MAAEGSTTFVAPSTVTDAVASAVPSAPMSNTSAPEEAPEVPDAEASREAAATAASLGKRTSTSALASAPAANVSVLLTLPSAKAESVAFEEAVVAGDSPVAAAMGRSAASTRPRTAKVAFVFPIRFPLCSTIGGCPLGGGGLPLG